MALGKNKNRGYVYKYSPLNIAWSYLIAMGYSKNRHDMQTKIQKNTFNKLAPETTIAYGLSIFPNVSGLTDVPISLGFT